MFYLICHTVIVYRFLSTVFDTLFMNTLHQCELGEEGTRRAANSGHNIFSTIASNLEKMCFFPWFKNPDLLLKFSTFGIGFQFYIDFIM